MNWMGNQIVNSIKITMDFLRIVSDFASLTTQIESNKVAIAANTKVSDI